MRIYAASRLTNDEFLVLDALACASAEHEGLLTLAALLDEYWYLSECIAPLEQTLLRLRTLGFAGAINGKWFATNLGRDVAQFAEHTARED